MNGRHTLSIGVASVILDIYESDKGLQRRNIRLVANTIDVIASREEFADVVVQLVGTRWRSLVRNRVLQEIPQEPTDTPHTGEFGELHWSFDGERTEIEAFNLRSADVERVLLAQAE